MMVIKRGTYVQDVAASIWEVTVPSGGVKGRPLAAYDSQDDSHEIDSWSFVDGILRVSFGVDSFTGTLEYEYQVEETNTPTTITGDGGVVNVTVHQYNNAPASQQ